MRAAPIGGAVAHWFTEFYRSLFLDGTGRIVRAVATLALLMIAVSGAVLVTRRVGGVGRWISRLRGPLAGRLHTKLARVAVPSLGLSALTTPGMTAPTFDLLPMDAASPAFPAKVSGQTGVLD